LIERQVRWRIRRKCRKLEADGNFLTPCLKLLSEHIDILADSELRGSQSLCNLGCNQADLAGLHMNELIDFVRCHVFGSASNLLLSDVPGCFSLAYIP
jgi:hypothetical protein